MTRRSLYLADPSTACAVCGGHRRRRKTCEACRQTGYSRFEPGQLWRGTTGFLVCGGPSLAHLPRRCFRRPGLVSVGVNNAAAYAGTTAATFGDPQWKFHHSLFLDPQCLVFAPVAKLIRCVRVKVGDRFHMTTRRLADCPSVVGLCRSGRFDASTFLDTWWAHWGYGGRQSDQPYRRLCSMMLGLRILYDLGCNRICLVGVDLFGDTYAWGDAISGGSGQWPKIAGLLESVRDRYAAAGCPIVHWSVESPLDLFTRVDVADEIAAATRWCDGPIDLAGWYSSRLLESHRHDPPLEDV